MITIRSGGMYAARSIFAEQCLHCGSKNAFLTDLPPGSPVKGERQIRWGVPQGGSKDPPAMFYSFHGAKHWSIIIASARALVSCVRRDKTMSASFSFIRSTRSTFWPKVVSSVLTGRRPRR